MVIRADEWANLTDDEIAGGGLSFHQLRAVAVHRVVDTPGTDMPPAAAL